MKQSWYVIALEPGIQRRSWIVALVVGSILNVINQGDALFTGKDLVIWKLVLTFCVPYCVATYGAVSARKAIARTTPGCET